MDDKKKIELLFEEGKSKYLNREYFDAHEVWEDLWSDYYLPDRKLVQGLIQLSVSLVHLNNGNLKGAKSLLIKSIFIIPFLDKCILSKKFLQSL